MTFEMKYCTRCLYPATKPRLVFNEEGVCSACTAFEARATIDWEDRKVLFNQLSLSIRHREHGQPYDCIVPVSGGKDSTYQVFMALKYGLRPLAVTAMTCDLTPIGWRNLQNISKLGVDHVMVQPDRKVRAKLNKYCLETVGDISWPEHVSIFTVPIREAVLRGIPLILYGECPENEYGGPLGAQGTHCMTPDWIHEFGGLCGLRPGDIVEQGLATQVQMEQYTYPREDELAAWGGEAVFLGYYFPWDSGSNVSFAKRHGFDAWGAPSGSWLAGENLDNEQTGLHNYLMYLKFGYGRATAQLSQEIRRGRMSRERAVELARKLDGEWPGRYVHKRILYMLDKIGMNEGDIWKVLANFANPALFDVDMEGHFITPKFEVK